MKTDKQHFCKERLRNLGRSVAPFLLCSVGVTLIFSSFILYPPKPFMSNTPKHGLGQKPVPGQSQKDDEKCNMFKGHWVPDLNGSQYTNVSCGTIPESKNCFKNGRMDRDFVNWRWKPDGCELPKFDPKAFLLIVRGKKMAFIGDSVARNHMESLLCLLSKEEIPINIYKDSEDRFRTWHFPYHDFTLMILWSKFLVAADEILINGSNSGIFNLHIDKIDTEWFQKLTSIDYAIISAGHWFFRKLYLHQSSNIIGCVYCNEPNITQQSLNLALKMSFRAALKSISGCKDCKKGMMTLLRTFSPAHFENGTWDTGGSCSRTSPGHDMGESGLWESYLEMRRVQIKEVGRMTKEVEGKREKKRFEVLDVTMAMLKRGDGHPGAYWGNTWMKGYNDCVHWCLPGPIDVWNDFLLAMLRNGASLSLH